MNLDFCLQWPKKQGVEGIILINIWIGVLFYAIKQTFKLISWKKNFNMQKRVRKSKSIGFYRISRDLYF